MAAQTARPLSQRPLFVCLLLTVIGLVSLLSSSAHAEVNVAYNLDDADPAVTYSGTWTAVNNVPTALYSTLHWSNTPGNSASSSFNGTTITYFYTMASNMGARYVYLDGALVSVFNGTAAETRRQVGRTYSLPTGYHTIRVEVAPVGGATGFTDVDLFAVDIASVGTGVYDDPNTQARYFGTWSNSTSM